MEPDPLWLLVKLACSDDEPAQQGRANHCLHATGSNTALNPAVGSPITLNLVPGPAFTTIALTADLEPDIHSLLHSLQVNPPLAAANRGGQHDAYIANHDMPVTYTTDCF